MNFRAGPRNHRFREKHSFFRKQPSTHKVMRNCCGFSIKTMDSVYSMYDAIASPRIEIKKYFEKYHEALKEEWCKESHADDDYSIASFMPSSLGEEELDILAEYCNIDQLNVPGELGKIEFPSTAKGGTWSFETTEIPKSVQLATLGKLEEVYTTQSPISIKTLRKYMGEVTIRYEKVQSDGPCAIPRKDTIIYIRVYEPCGNRIASSTGRRMVLSSMVAILGSQTLDKVRDLIDCISDLSISKEVSENPDAPIEPAAKDVYKSGFFYIEGTFYNDFRDSANEDNSQVIRKWAEARKLGPFETARMEETRVDSLSVRFGYPWVYQHQGKCEHLIVFSDARLLNVDDELAVSAYPRVHRLKQRRCRYCMMCGVSAVRWITTDSDRIPHNPCYLCEVCFKSYNYIDGKKVGSFKAFRYPDYPELIQNEPTTVRGQKKTSKYQGNSNKTSSKTMT